MTQLSIVYRGRRSLGVLLTGGLALLATQPLLAAGPGPARPAAPAAPYTLQGDVTNPLGNAPTTFQTTSGSTAGGWNFVDNTTGGIALTASCPNGSDCIGVAGTGVNYGVTGTGGNYGVRGMGAVLGVEGRGTGFGSTGVEGIGETSGVEGINLGTDNGHGVDGEGGRPPAGTTIGAVGVRGYSEANNGVFGHTSGQTVANLPSGSIIAGVYGYNENKAGGLPRNVGVYGLCSTCTGVFGQSDSSFGVFGQSTNSTGVRGVSTNNIGMVGVSTSSYGAYISSWSGTGLYARTSIGQYAIAAAGNVIVTGNVTVTGSLWTKNGGPLIAVTTSQGERTTYGDSSTQQVLSDRGTATLKNGRAVITIDPLYAQLVSLGTDYQVFVTPNSADTLGLAVIHKTTTGFEVRELGKGAGSFRFDWRIEALRKGYETTRLAPVPVVPAAPGPVQAPVDLAAPPAPVPPAAPGPGPTPRPSSAAPPGAAPPTGK